MSARSAARLRRAGEAVHRWDIATSARVAGARSPAVIERGLPLLTRAADRSVLWTGVAAAMSASGNPHLRRAALRGLASIALSSLLANQVGKRILPRTRPLVGAVPRIRLAHRVPVSSSFPSGHSASAAAFAVGASLEAPRIAVPLGALAGAVAFSRVYTGVHFPSDVVAGVAIGATVAGVGKVLVPAHHRPPVRLGREPARPQPARPTGAGLVAVVNLQSGTADGELAAELAKALPDAEIIGVGPDDDVLSILREAAARAEVIGVAGGDGTITCAATAAIEADRPLLVFPAGTFNHFAKDLDIETPDDSLDALREGRAIRIDVGDVDGQLFLNTSSLGSYPEFVRIRERWEKPLGKPLAAAVAMITVLRTTPPLEAVIDGTPRRLLLLFIGNNDYHPRGFVPRWRGRMDSGRLDVRYVDASRRGTMLRLLAATLSGDFYRAGSYFELHCPQVDVRLSSAGAMLARDGEIDEAPGEVRYSLRRQALTVYRGPARPS
jgi:diacylglycerol kinase family enzyme/membrane-associated phospholipid phosphatase